MSLASGPFSANNPQSLLRPRIRIANSRVFPVFWPRKKTQCKAAAIKQPPRNSTTTSGQNCCYELMLRNRASTSPPVLSFHPWSLIHNLPLAALFSVLWWPTQCTLQSPLVDCNPLVIAHRGASAYLPEHTLQAYVVCVDTSEPTDSCRALASNRVLNRYRLAIELGSDFIEPDLVATKDKVRRDAARFRAPLTDVVSEDEIGV